MRLDSLNSSPMLTFGSTMPGDRGSTFIQAALPFTMKSGEPMMFCTNFCRIMILLQWVVHQLKI